MSQLDEQHPQTTRSGLDPSNRRKSDICVSDGLAFVLDTMHMMLWYRSGTLPLLHGSETVHPAFVQRIVQGLPPKKSPRATVHLDVAQAVLPTMRTQSAHPNSVVLYIQTAAQLAALTSVKHCHTHSPRCTPTHDLFLLYTATYYSFDTLVSVLSLYPSQKTSMPTSFNV